MDLTISVIRDDIEVIRMRKTYASYNNAESEANRLFSRESKMLDGPASLTVSVMTKDGKLISTLVKKRFC